MKIRIGVLVWVAALAVSAGATAQTYQVIAEPLNLVALEYRDAPGGQRKSFGGCYARLASQIITLSTPQGNCNNEFITFACDGSGSVTKAEGIAMYQQAQLAYVTGKPLKARIVQTRLDGVCQAINAQVEEPSS